MTKAEWLACADPAKMLEFLRGRVSERKMRLFACACCRRLWGLLPDRHARKALAVAERYADDEVSADKLRFAWGDARRAAQVVYREERETAEASAMWAVSLLCESDAARAIAVGLAASCEAYPAGQPRLAEAQREQSLLLRDVVGDPFRHVAVPPAVLAWNGGSVVRLAQAAYEERHLPSGTLAGARLAVLADALEEAGCNDTEILDHLRGPGPHVRGCFVLDLLLGKS